MPEKNFEPTDLDELLGKVMDDLHELAEKQQAVIAKGILPRLSVISFQFEQLFTNLIINAIKFARQDVLPEITITSEILPAAAIVHPYALAGKRYHHISFSDNGIGFDPQFIEHIFLVFQRLHTKETYDGMGIGLAICKKTVENHNGFIAPTAVPGAEATFDIYIPVS